MNLVPGVRLRGSADSTEVIVVRPANEDVDLRCGGHPMIELGAQPEHQPTIEPAYDSGTQLGKRYVHEASGLEVLCTKAGDGSLSVGTDVLELKGTKALPSSD